MTNLKTILTDVPDGDMLEVVDDFTSDGANVSVIRQPDGKWTVKALYLRHFDPVNEPERKSRRPWWLTRERAEGGV